jgi:hypothetical protein
LDLTQLSRLEFFPPDTDRFPCIELAYNALRTGGTMPAVLNAANEVAVSAFLDERLPFGEIPRLIRAACEAHTAQSVLTLDGVLAADNWARQWTSRRIAERAQTVSLRADAMGVRPALRVSLRDSRAADCGARGRRRWTGQAVRLATIALFDSLSGVA